MSNSKLYFLAISLIALMLINQLNAKLEFPSLPSTKKKFSNPKEIEAYIKKLKSYYQVISRPRYLMQFF
jgi:hypothetical protein